MLLMRGGVLIIAPFVDLMPGRPVRSAPGSRSALSLAAVGAGALERRAYRMTLVAALNIAAYLGGLRGPPQRHVAPRQGRDPDVNRRYFIEETFVAAVALVVIPALVALVGPGPIAGELRAGFTGLSPAPSRPCAADRAPLWLPLPVRDVDLPGS